MEVHGVCKPLNSPGRVNDFKEQSRLQTILLALVLFVCVP